MSDRLKEAKLRRERSLLDKYAPRELCGMLARADVLGPEELAELLFYLLLFDCRATAAHLCSGREDGEALRACAAARAVRWGAFGEEVLAFLDGVTSSQ